MQFFENYRKAILFKTIAGPHYLSKIHYVLLTAVLILTAGCEGGKTVSHQPAQPNIILIMADDLGYETLGVNGNTAYSTPNLDKLAQEGMRFTSAYSTPLCTPTRVQLMTGKYNFRNYVGFGILDPGQHTFGTMLQNAGYATVVAGKWQLYGNPQQREMFGRSGTLPNDAGFDEYYLWQIDTRPGSRFKDPGLNLNSAEVQMLSGSYGPDVFADSLISFMQRQQDQPFFAYFPMTLTHDPFQPTPGHSEYDAFDPISQSVNDAAYFADNMAYMDKVVGRIVDAVDKMGTRENTIIMFIGDNGTDRDIVTPYQGEEIRGNKGYPNRYGTHVPMIVNWQGHISPGQVNDNLIDFTDFVPTLMDLAGATLPTDDVFDGLSFRDQLLGEADSVRSWVFCHYAPQWGRFEHVRYIHNKNWKLYDDGRVFNIAEDPHEATPLDPAMLPADASATVQSFEKIMTTLQ